MHLPDPVIIEGRVTSRARGSKWMSGSAKALRAMLPNPKSFCRFHPCYISELEPFRNDRHCIPDPPRRYHEQLSNRCKKQHKALETDQVCLLKQLQDENARLKRLVFELNLDKTMLQDVLSRKALAAPPGGKLYAQGLSRKLQGLYALFIIRSVPAWAFAFAFLIALLGVGYFASHVSNPGKIHFVPEQINCYWSQEELRGKSVMSVGIGGTFTFEGSDPTIKVLSTHLRNTHQARDMEVFVPSADGSSGYERCDDMELSSHVPTRAFLHIHLYTAIGTEDRTLRARIFLKDHLNREYAIGPVELGYKASEP